MSITFEELQAQVSDLFRADGHSINPDVTAGLCRVMVAVRNSMISGGRGKRSVATVLVSPTAIRAAYHDGANAKTGAGRTLLRPGTMLFDRLDDALMEIYGIKMLHPELWNKKYCFIDLIKIHRNGWHQSQAKFIEALAQDVPEPLTILTNEELGE